MRSFPALRSACLAGLAGLAVALGAAGHAAPAQPSGSARKTVQTFLDWEQQAAPSGVREATLGEPLRSLLSAELLCLLRAAAAANEISRRTAPGDKPPFVEGNLFLPSAWERPAERRVVSVKRHGNESRVRVSFRYEPGAQSYTSTYFVEHTARPPRISDIGRGGTCDFCQSGRLRTALREALKDFPGALEGDCRAAR